MSAGKGVMAMLARGLPQSLESRVKLLEGIRSDGNEMFIERNWAAAVSKYSDCINLASTQLDINYGFHDKAIQEKYNRVVMLAYSNRAEGNLRLLKYVDALHDAEMALQTDSKHVKTLVRKGKAAHGLGFFEKACETFKCALAESSEEQSILQLLMVSRVAFEQSRTGNYDLINFFSRGCTGDIPSCADFVGSVKIRRASSGHGRRGLFATRSVDPGELLLVSNPLAVVRRNRLKADDTAQYYCAKGLRQKILRELVERIGRSKLEMARLYSLANKGEQEMEIPSMELFKPGSERTLPDALKLEVNMELIRNSAKQIFEFADVTGPELDPKTEVYTGVMGLWVLPAFAKHSCAPNCQHSFVGDTIFFRASGHITEGEELTIPYFADLFKDVKTRQEICKNVWQFTCNCERCIFEKSLQLQFWKLKSVMHVHVAEAERLAKLPGVMDPTRELSLRNELGKVVDGVEALIRSLGTSLSPEQQGWIRAAFIAVYMNKSTSEDHTRDPPSSMLSLRSVLDALTSVYVTPRALRVAAMLRVQLDRTSFKHTQLYRDQLLNVYKRVFGKHPDMFLYKLIEKWIPA